MNRKTRFGKDMYTSIGLYIGMLLISSCSGFIDIPAPVTQIETKAVFEDEGAALSAALGTYQGMRSSSLYLCDGGVTLYTGLSSDELLHTGSNAELLSFQNNAVIANNGTGIYTRMWMAGYTNVFNTNAVIEGLKGSSGLSEVESKQLMGEMLVIRAFNYFYLVNLFGAVPLQTNTDYQVNAILPRADAKDVYEQIIDDLVEAKSYLSSEYPSANKARINYWTATSLLARVYLFLARWEDAAMEATKVIDSGQYTLELELEGVFQQNSRETIWQLASDVRNTGEGATFIPTNLTARPQYILTDYVIDLFGTEDKRRLHWIGKSVNNGTDYFFPQKYKMRTSTPVTEYYVALRLAELYLIRAEAFMHLNNMESALIDLNILRNRAGADNLSLDESDLMQEILDEWGREFFCEWGHRWLDLKRTGKADEMLTVRKSPNWESTDQLYPLPLSELLANPFLIQNEGY